MASSSDAGSQAPQADSSLHGDLATIIDGRAGPRFSEAVAGPRALPTPALTLLGQGGALSNEAVARRVAVVEQHILGWRFEP
jgi:hypothetical protein